jgi:hypothetical protein
MVFLLQPLFAPLSTAALLLLSWIIILLSPLWTGSPAGTAAPELMVELHEDTAIQSKSAEL